MNSIGIDIGSTYVKYCVLGENNNTIELFSERTPIRQKEYFSEKIKYFHSRYQDCPIVSCGYGKHNIDSVKCVTELSALAAGLYKQCPDIDFALDIGGQDTKTIRQEKGKLKEFFLNEKCAAGSGLFLQNVLSILNLDFEDINLFRQDTEQQVKLSSVCAVFAQSEIVELIANGTEPISIALGTLRQIFNQASALTDKINLKGTVAICGGLTQILGIEDFAKQCLNLDAYVPMNAQYLSAIGCAIIAKE